MEKDAAEPQDKPTLPEESAARNARMPEPNEAPPADEKADKKDDPRPVHSQPDEPAFTRSDSTIFDFDRLRTNTRKPNMSSDQTDEEKE